MLDALKSFTPETTATVKALSLEAAGTALDERQDFRRAVEPEHFPTVRAAALESIDAYITQQLEYMQQTGKRDFEANCPEQVAAWTAMRNVMQEKGINGREDEIGMGPALNAARLGIVRFYSNARKSPPQR